MIFRNLFLLGIILLKAVQSSQVAPSLASDEVLITNEINLIILSDVHGWVAGHEHRDFDVDFGDVYSLHERLKSKLNDQNQDLLFVMCGDFMHGTALADDPPTTLVSILNRMPFDLVSLGRHDLEMDETIQTLEETGGIVESWGPALITSNVWSNYTNAIMGNPMQMVKLPKSGKTVMAVSFLDPEIDLAHHKPLSKLTTIESVEAVLGTTWFREAVRATTFDVLLIMTDIEADNPLRGVILDTIRDLAHDPELMVLFLMHDTQKTRFQKLDNNTYSMESGYNMETIGFLSMDPEAKVISHSFLEANEDDLKDALNLDSSASLMTEEGAALSQYIQDTAKEMGILDVIGCMPRTFYLDKPIADKSSLMRLYLKEVLPKVLLSEIPHDEKSTNILIQDMTGVLQHDLPKGRVTVNDVYTMIPHDDTIFKRCHSLRGDKVLRLQGHLSYGKGMILHDSSDAVLISTADKSEIDKEGGYEVYAASREMDHMGEILSNMRARHVVKEEVNDGKTTLRSIWVDYIRWNLPCADGSSVSPETNDSTTNASDATTEAPVGTLQSTDSREEELDDSEEEDDVGVPGGSSGTATTTTSTRASSDDEESESSHKAGAMILVVMFAVAAVVPMVLMQRLRHKQKLKEDSERADLAYLDDGERYRDEPGNRTGGGNHGDDGDDANDDGSNAESTEPPHGYVRPLKGTRSRNIV